MYKSKLQELCQRRSWELPEYNTKKEGPDHMPRFTASVVVKGQVFETPTDHRSSKEAQNTAARMAFDHLSGPMPAPPSPVDHATPAPAPAFVSLVVSPPASSLPMPTGLLLAKNDAKIKPTGGEVSQLNYEDTTEASIVNMTSICSHDKSYKDALHMYKNLLQQHAQKQNLGFPVYTSEAEGPPHARRFKSKVSVGGKTFETLEFFSTLKEAEQAAAKVACQFFVVDATHEEGGLYKNLLQEFAQKKGLLCPSYDTVSSGMSHRPVFVSTVEIGSATFRGAEAKTKKQAEMNAAKVAYSALTENRMVTETTEVSPTKELSAADNLRNDIQPTPVAKNSEDAILASSIGEKHEDVTSTPVPLSKKHEDATDEGAWTQAKRAKSSPEKEDVNHHLPGFSNASSASGNNLSSPASQGEHPTASDVPVPNQQLDAQPSPRTKTLVFPRKSDFPIPEGASVMPYSDEQWVAYKVEQQQEPTS